MNVYTLPDSRPIEVALLRKLQGSSRSPVEWRTFLNGEFSLRIPSVSGVACVIGRCDPPAENLVRTLFLIDTLRRSGSKKIILVLPYFGYCRQDRQVQPGDGVPAGCISSLFTALKVDEIITADLHSQRIAHECPVPLSDISLLPLMARALQAELPKSECAIISPDKGGCARAEKMASLLGRDPSSIVWIEKERDRQGVVSAKKIHGTSDTRVAVLVDDIIDTGGTIVQTVRLLRENGFQEFYLCATHGIFSNTAASVLKESGFKKIILSDTLPLSRDVTALLPIEVVGAADFLGDAVLRSVSAKHEELSRDALMLSRDKE